MAEISDKDLDPPAASTGARQITEADLDPVPTPSIWDRIKGAASTVGNTAKEGAIGLGHFAARAVPAAIDLVNPFSKSGGLQVPFGQLADPSYRHELERGVSDVVTGGMAERAANMVSPEFAASAAPDVAAHPGVREAGQLVGSLLPSPAKGLGEKAAGETAAALKGVKVLGSRPVTSALAGAAGAGTQAAATDVMGGRPLLDTLRDTGGAALVGGGLGLGLGATGAAAENLVSKARSRATRDIANDIVAAEGKRARMTDQKRIADVSDRLYDLTRENPELREVWRQPAEKALPKIAEVKHEIAQPLDQLYGAVDRLTGGIRLGDILDGFESEANQAGKSAHGQSQATRLRGVRDNFIKAYGDDPDVRIPTAKFREEVTNLHKTAEQAMGTIEGTARHEALDGLYRVGKQIIDQHLDNSGLNDTNLALLRKTNDQYFLLSRAQAAIESRGVKEANKPSLSLPRSVHGALNMGLPVAAGFAAMHPHVIPEMALAYGIGHAAPSIASQINWRLAGLSPAAGAAAASKLNPALIAPLANVSRNPSYDLAQELQNKQQP